VQPSLQRSVFDRQFVRRLARLTGLYWRSRDARTGALLLALAIAFELATVYGSFVIADANRRIYDALQDRVAAAFFSGVALFVGGFLILNSFNMTVLQRMRELGMLRTLGASRRMATTSVLIEALVIGVVGTVLGLALGLGLAMALLTVVSGIAAQRGELEIAVTIAVRTRGAGSALICARMNSSAAGTRTS